MFRHAAMIDRLRRGENLEPGEMETFLSALASGLLPNDEIREFLVRLRERGETAEDIIEAARVLRRHAIRLPRDFTEALDTCGTGGDALRTVNVSTLAALAAASAGVRIAKHGNRSVSGLVGSADLLEALGIRVGLSPEEAAACLETTGFAFLFAPLFHPAMKAAAEARRGIKGRTLFNCLGPLSNPAGARFQLVGVYERRLVEPVARALGGLGAKHAIVVHGDDGSDEVSVSGPTFTAEWTEGRIETKQVHPEEFGLDRVELRSVQCGTPEEAVRTAREVLGGKSGPALDFVVLNGAFALRAAGHTPDIAAGICLLRGLFEKGAVRQKVEQIRVFTEKNVLSR